MANKETVFDQIKGLTPVDPEALADFEREMIENVIPEITEALEERQLLAEESRIRELEVLFEKDK
jgi:hypothetical protein